MAYPSAKIAGSGSGSAFCQSGALRHVECHLRPAGAASGLTWWRSGEVWTQGDDYRVSRKVRPYKIEKKQ